MAIKVWRRVSLSIGRPMRGRKPIRSSIVPVSLGRPEGCDDAGVRTFRDPLPMTLVHETWEPLPDVLSDKYAVLVPMTHPWRGIIFDPNGVSLGEWSVRSSGAWYSVVRERPEWDDEREDMSMKRKTILRRKSLTKAAEAMLVLASSDEIC